RCPRDARRGRAAGTAGRPRRARQGRRQGRRARPVRARGGGVASRSPVGADVGAVVGVVEAVLLLGLRRRRGRRLLRRGLLLLAARRRLLLAPRPLGVGALLGALLAGAQRA